MGYNPYPYNFKPDRTNESLQRLTESDLYKIIKESVKRIISEKYCLLRIISDASIKYIL